MTAEQNQMLRDALVAALVVSAPISLPLGTLRMTAKAAGFMVDDATLSGHIDYLVKKGLVRVKEAPKKLSAVVRWESTAEAVDYCEAEGLV
jgi:DNA-binding MarR family transcriptional regulator